MNHTATQYADAARSLAEVLDAVPASGWESPSPCAGWTARDVVGHVIETQREFLASHGADLGAAPDLADPAEAWRTHAGRVARVLADDDVTARAFEGFSGPTTVGAALEQYYVWDVLVHRWDVARAVGIDAAFTDQEVDRIEAGADSFGPALYMEGICGPALDAPAGADRTSRVLARLGRSG